MVKYAGSTTRPGFDLPERRHGYLSAHRDLFLSQVSLGG
jgi:hypothetical protein